MSVESMDKALLAARARLDAMHASEAESNFAAPEECPPLLHFRTGVEALKAGLSIQGDGGWECIAEGIVMLQDFERRVWEQS